MPLPRPHSGTLFPGDPTRILKGLYGSFLIRDWRGSATSLGLVAVRPGDR